MLYREHGQGQGGQGLDHRFTKSPRIADPNITNPCFQLGHPDDFMGQKM